MQENELRQTIVILCPVYNESENVEIFFERFKSVCSALEPNYHISFLFADNCSTDDTFDKLNNLCLKNQNIRVIRYSRNFGVMKSIFTGLVHSEGDAVTVFDCDLQDPPELLLQFVQAWEEGAKIVYGVRAKRDESRLLGYLRQGFRKLEAIFKSYKTDIESGAWFLDKRVVLELKRSGRYEPYLAGLIGRMGFKSVGIPYERNRRLRGKTKFGLFSYFSYAADGLVSGTIAPLRIAILAGLVLSSLSFIAMVYFVIAKFILGAPFASGVAAAIVIMLFGFGVNFVFLGIIGEYVGRIYLDRELSESAIVEVSINSEDLQIG